MPPPTQAAPSDLDILDDPVEQRRFTRWTALADGLAVGESSWLISGMYCAACAGIIESAVGSVDGVVEVRVSSAAQRARIVWDPARTRASDLVRAIRGAGYDAVPDAAAPAREMRRAERRKGLWRLFVASFCAMQVMMFATPSYVAHGNELAPDLRQLLNWASWLLSIPVLLMSAGPYLQSAWRAVRARHISMEVPVALGVLVTFAASTGATFAPGGVFGDDVYFDSMTMFVAFLLAGRFLEMTARHRAAEALELALSGMPQTAIRLLDDGRTEVVSLHRLTVGDRVQVNLGGAYPADGVLEVGRTQADESLLTGESRPVPKVPGDDLVGGSINLGGPVVMRLLRVGADTRYEAIVAMMRDAMSQRPSLARWADAWAAPFLWAVLILAAGSAAVWSVVEPGRAVWVAVSVLIVTCPCALSLAAPAALVAATGALARRGVMVQRLDGLEALARMDQLFLDKTGTLTEERPVLQELRSLDGQPLALALGARAASLARWSSHPLAQALAGDERIAPLGDGSIAWADVQETPGLGLRAVDSGQVAWRLGSWGWVSGLDQADPIGSSALQVWFGTGAVDAICFTFAEQVRPDVPKALAALRHEGVQVTLLSGDMQARAVALGQPLGIEHIVGGALPEDKLNAVAQSQAKGHVVGMVGDGVNDAPVLARADISIAMGQGALVARANADAVVTSSRLMDVVHARTLARRAMRIVRQNLAWAAAYNLACVPLAMIGWLPPWAAGLGMACSSLLVVANAMRLAR